MPMLKGLLQGNNHSGHSPDPDKYRDGTGYMTAKKQIINL